VKETVRSTPPHVGATISYRYEITSKRLQAVKFKQHDDTIYFQPKANSTHVVGYVRLNFGDRGELNIDFLEVYEPFRKKKGYGREIYEWTESYAKERGIKKITVISLEEAIGFWKKMGLKRGVWSKPGYQSMTKALDDSQA
jgi:GNAT superfamily N-acetyltransferase